MALLPSQLDDEVSLRPRIDALNANYVHAIDDDRLEDWPNFFTADGEYSISTRENHEMGLPICLVQCKGTGMFRDRITALRQANIYEPHTYCHSVRHFIFERISRCDCNKIKLYSGPNDVRG